MPRSVLQCVCAIFFLLAPVFVQAQNPSSSSDGITPVVSTPVIRTTVRRVVVDVAVADANQQPVRGLHREDFALTEDGAPQHALSFEAHEMDASDDASGAVAPPGLPANTFVNLPTQPERGPLYILLYDMTNTSNDEQVWARKELLKFMASKPSGTRYAVFALSDGLHLIQGFTTDPVRLQAALDVSGKVPHMPKNFLYGDNYGGGNGIATVAVFEDIRLYVEGLPGRKNLLWVSERFPLGLFAPIPRDLIEQQRHELISLANQQIAIYPVNTSLGSAWEQNIVVDEVAHLTGGHAIYGSNDLVGSLTQATNEGASYYTLSYDPTNHVDDGKLRRIDIRLNAKLARAGLHLTFRREYYADLPDGTVSLDDPFKKPVAHPGLPPQPPDTLATEMCHGWPMSHGMLFAAHIKPVGSPTLATPEQMAELAPDTAYFTNRRKNRSKSGASNTPDPIPLQAYMIEYTVPTHQLLAIRRQDAMPAAVGTAPTVTLEFAAAAYNADGLLLNGTIDHATAASTGTKPAFRPTVHIEQPFPVPVGAAWLRLAVRDVDTGEIGSLEFSLPLANAPQQ